MPRMLTTLVLSVALAATLSAACASANAASARRQPVVPLKFRGEWNATPAHCGTGLNDSRLVIRGGHIQFYESQGEILAVVTRGPDELAVIAELSGDGDTWLHYSRFILSDDGRTLTNGADGPAPVKLQRCPAALAR